MGGSGIGASFGVVAMEPEVVSLGMWVAVWNGLRSGSTASCERRCVRGDSARCRERGDAAREPGEARRGGERSQYRVSAGVLSCVCTWVECAGVANATEPTTTTTTEQHTGVHVSGWAPSARKQAAGLL
jgi:hypothetical protein